MNTLLVIDDSVSFLDDIEVLLSKRFAILRATTAKQGFNALKTAQVDAILLDLDLPDQNGIDLLTKIRKEYDPHIPVIIITYHGDVSTAVSAMRAGAYDFIQKDFDLEVLHSKIQKALERRELEITVDALRDNYAEQQHAFVIGSPAMRTINSEIERIARTDFDVLIIGETGVGKDRTAFELHRRSSRSDKPYIAMPIRSLNESLIESELFGHEKGAYSGADSTKVGILESANSGTIYIPEISSLTESVQLKLLHFMQYKTISRVGQDPRKPPIRVNVRVVMATNENIPEAVRKGRVREDFFYRISGVSINIPPLRERLDDIEPLAKYFLQQHGRLISPTPFTFDKDVIPFLRSLRWMGNIRELENAVKNALAYAHSPMLTLADFSWLTSDRFSVGSPSQPAEGSGSIKEFRLAESDFRKNYFTSLLRSTGGNISQAANVAGLSRQSLHKNMKALKLTY